MAKPAPTPPAPPPFPTPPNKPPVAGDDGPYSTAYNTNLTLNTSTLLANDKDNTKKDALTITEITADAGGTATLNGQQIVFNPDDTFSGAASFTYKVSDGAKGGTDTGDVTINVGAPPSLPTISIITEPPAEEGNSLAFSFELDKPSLETVTVQYSTSGGSATPGEDYGPSSGIITFTPGDTRETVAISTSDDTLVELSETVGLVLSNAVNATIANNSVAGTITDNDVAPPPLPTASIQPFLGVSEDTFGIYLTVSLSRPTDQDVSGTWTAFNGDAQHNIDWTGTQVGTFLILAGQTSTQVGDFTTLADDVVEQQERFHVRISEIVNATPAPTSASGGTTGTVLVNDSTPAPAATSTDDPFV